MTTPKNIEADLQRLNAKATKLRKALEKIRQEESRLLSSLKRERLRLLVGTPVKVCTLFGGDRRLSGKTGVLLSVARTNAKMDFSGERWTLPIEWLEMPKGVQA